MTTDQKNIAIAEMLGAVQEQWYPPNKDNKTTGVHLAFKANGWYPDNQRYHADCHLKFHSDANWQFEAIQWVENIRLNNLKLYDVQIGGKTCSIRSEEYTINEERRKNKDAFKHFYAESSSADSKKEAIFEALYQFSQHIKTP